MITQHEGQKYLRKIRGWRGSKDGGPPVNLKPTEVVHVDVYAVLVAFGVTCPATAHAVTKLLCAGQRGKGDQLADLIGAKAAIERAIEIHGMVARP